MIHFGGHIALGKSGPALVLANGEPLTAPVIESSLSGRPLVFLNGCGSARGSEVGGLLGEDDLSSVASGFLLGGAVGVVGTLCDVGDEGASELAKELYAHLLEDGASIGEALRRARHALRASQPESAVSLAFVLYGNPAQVISPAAAPRRDGGAPRSAVPAPPGERVVAKRPRYARWAAFVVLTLFVASVLAYYGFHERRVTVGVMDTKGDDTPIAMRTMTRDGLNTIFSKIGALKVYSKQKIDFLRSKRGLSEIEVAEELGITKMISPSIAVSDSTVRIDVEIVDVGRNGLLEASESVHGPAQSLIELQNRIAERVLRSLGVAPSSAELAAIFADRTNETFEGYKLLAETMAGSPGPDHGGPSPVQPSPSPGSSWLDISGIAFADATGTDEAAIRALLQEYGSALQAKSIDRLARTQVEMTESQRSALEKYFANATDLKVRISDVDIVVEGDDALATFTREDAFTDAPTGKPTRLEVRIEQSLVKRNGVWRIHGGRAPD